MYKGIYVTPFVIQMLTSVPRRPPVTLVSTADRASTLLAASCATADRATADAPVKQVLFLFERGICTQC